MNKKQLDKLDVLITHQPKSIDPHAVNKARYADDYRHTKEPWKIWEFLMLGEWIPLYSGPAWFEGVEYRRKIDAPVWLKSVDIVGRLTEYMRPKSKYLAFKRGDRILVSDGIDAPYLKMGLRK